MPFPDAGAARWALSTRGGIEPVWSRKGDELFFRDMAGSMVAVQVRTTPTFVAGAQTELFPSAGYEQYEGHRQYDVAPDGRFLMLRPRRAPDATKVVLVRSWIETVRAKLAERAR